MSKTKAVIFDIDGTISDSERCEWHKKLIEQGDWSWFKEIAENAPVIEEPMRALLSTIHRGDVEVVLVTARQEAFRELTVKWLGSHGVPSDTTLVMRPAKMNGWPDWQFKLSTFKQFSKWHDFVAAYDDKPEICKLWEILGIPTVIQVTHKTP